MVDFLLLASITALTYHIIVTIYEGQLTMRLFLALHLISIFIAGFWTWFRHNQKRDLKYPVIFLILTFFLSSFGIFIGMTVIIVQLMTYRYKHSFEDWWASIFPEEEHDAAEDLQRRLISGWEDLEVKHKMLSFMDVMILGTMNQKRDVLAKISRYYRHEFAPVLKRAINDPVNAIRVMAATVIAKIQNQYVHEYMHLLKQYEADPGSDVLLLKLARSIDKYVYSGIMDSDSEREFRNKAIVYYEKYLENHPEKTQVQFALGRLYLYNRDYQKAYPLLESCVKADNYNSPNIGVRYMESLYAQGRMEELKEIAHKYLDKVDPNDPALMEIFEILRFWTEGIPESRLVVSEPRGSEHSDNALTPSHQISQG
ncbi:MAG: hypothetical protein HQM12_07165 [SAR324 cluster bacterium]|nr:hypothetical protein [SAR324 cluster bacterium]